ncbi:MAG: LacI family DNA-binding transcriptional regulator [Methylobacteriaceae bacterium]|nr:LacI family DNA-binding transcriptional regulator [Methylobacteriaceae bacterium]
MSVESGGKRQGAGQPVTLQIIAAELGVSTATVSLALRGNPAVAEATRERVQAQARALGYVYNRSAASLRTAKTHIIAVCVHDITSPYFAEMLTSIEDVASAAGRTLLLGTYGESLERQRRLLQSFREYRPDGVILCPAAGTRPEDVRMLTEAGAPVVQLSREMVGGGLDFVGSNDADGTARAVAHLISLGHRRIAYFGGKDEVSTGAQRHAAFLAAMRAHGLAADPSAIFPGWGRRETGLAAVEQALARAEPPTAAVCFNDLTAFGAMLGLYRLGKQPGRDFSLVGYDDVREASQWAPPLTTLAHETDPGRAAAELLLARIADPARAAQRLALTPVLRVRGTTAAPRA